MQKSTGHWVITGVLGLAVLGSGCATQPAGHAASQQVGPAVVLEVDRVSTVAPPAHIAPTKASGGTGAAVSASSPDDDDSAKRVPVGKPKSMDSADSAPSAPTP